MRHTTLLFVISISDSLLFFFFFFNDTATTEIYTLSLHDALPIFIQWLAGNLLDSALQVHEAFSGIAEALPWREDRKSTRLNSSHLVISYAVFCLKKKKNIRLSFQPPMCDRHTHPRNTYRHNEAVL